jgi:hypothetical protein
MLELLSAAGTHVDTVDKGPERGDMAMIIEHDKELSLTQCRFEARSLYHIDDVLVSDFDEFVYCPSAASNAFTDGLSAHRSPWSMAAQRTYLENAMEWHKGRGRQQFKGFVYIPLNRSEPFDIRTCLKAAIDSNRTLFSCWWDTSIYRKWQWMVKTIHLGLACPYTTIHESCSGTLFAPPQYDCMCYDNLFELYAHHRDEHDNRYAQDHCRFIHLSTNPDYYIDDDNWSTNSSLDISFYEDEKWPIFNRIRPANLTTGPVEIYQVNKDIKRQMRRESNKYHNF